MKRKTSLNPISIFGLWLLAFIIFELSTGFLRGVGYPKLDCIISFVKCFLLTYIVFHKWKKEFIPYFFALNVFYLIVPFIALFQYLYFEKIYLGGWFSFFSSICGGWLAYLSILSKRKLIRYAIYIVSVLMLPTLLFSYKYIKYFNIFGGFDYIAGKVIDPGLYYLTNKNGEKVKLSNDVLYILDFWNTSCGYCFSAFPLFDKKNKKNKDENIIYTSINYPLPGYDSINEAFEVLKKYHYSFSQLKGSYDIDSVFGVVAYPTIIAIKNDTILYKGDLERLNDFLLNYNEKIKN